MRKYTVVILNQLNIKNNKIDKDNFKKNHVREHCSNPQCFKEKTMKLNSQPAQYEKNKIDKDNSGKKTKTIIKKMKKKPCGETL
jgi:hypothetical protein